MHFDDDALYLVPSAPFFPRRSNRWSHRKIDFPWAVESEGGLSEAEFKASQVWYSRYSG